jgi:hypothetical protein
VSMTKSFSQKLAPGTLILKCQLTKLSGTQYIPYIVVEIRDEKFLAHPVRPDPEHPPTWFIIDMVGHTWK